MLVSFGVCLSFSFSLSLFVSVCFNLICLPRNKSDRLYIIVTGQAHKQNQFELHRVCLHHSVCCERVRSSFSLSLSSKNLNVHFCVVCCNVYVVVIFSWTLSCSSNVVISLWIFLCILVSYLVKYHLHCITLHYIEMVWSQYWPLFFVFYSHTSFPSCSLIVTISLFVSLARLL